MFGYVEKRLRKDTIVNFNIAPQAGQQIITIHIFPISQEIIIISQQNLVS